MLKSTNIGHGFINRRFGQEPIVNSFDLEEKVVAMNKEKLKMLQDEMVELSLLNNQQTQVGLILKEIIKVRALLSLSEQKTQAS